MSSSPKSIQAQKDDLLREFIRKQIWNLFMAEEDLSLYSDNEIFKEVAADLIKIDKQRPYYIPKKFYKMIAWHRHVAEENIATMNMTYDGNKTIKAAESNKISYLTNLISDDLTLRDFYIVNGAKDELLLDIGCLFKGLAEWQYDYKTSGRQDAIVAKKLRKSLLNCASLLIDSPDVRLNLQMHWHAAIQARESADLRNTLLVLADYLAEIEPLAARKTSYAKKIHAVDAFVHYAVRRLKELFEKHRVPKRQHVKYINDIINAVMKENTSEDSIRKLVA